jgi:hypothetical protein
VVVWAHGHAGRHCREVLPDELDRPHCHFIKKVLPRLPPPVAGTAAVVAARFTGQRSRNGDNFGSSSSSSCSTSTGFSDRGEYIGGGYGGGDDEDYGGGDDAAGGSEGDDRRGGPGGKGGRRVGRGGGGWCRGRGGGGMPGGSEVVLRAARTAATAVDNRLTVRGFCVFFFLCSFSL